MNIKNINIIEIKDNLNFKNMFNFSSILNLGKDKIYNITIDINIQIERAFSDFFWLYDILIKKFPYLIIRNINNKESFESYESIFEELLKDIYENSYQNTEYFIKFISENVKEFYNFKSKNFINNNLNFLEKNYSKMTMNTINYMNDSILLNLKDPKINKIFSEIKNYKEFLPIFINNFNKFIDNNTNSQLIMDNIKKSSNFFTDKKQNIDENAFLDENFYEVNELDNLKIKISKLYECLERRNNLFFEYAQIDNYLIKAQESMNKEKKVLLQENLIEIKEKIKIFNNNFNDNLINYYNQIQKKLNDEFNNFHKLIKK